MESRSPFWSTRIFEEARQRAMQSPKTGLEIFFEVCPYCHRIGEAALYAKGEYCRHQLANIQTMATELGVTFEEAKLLDKKECEHRHSMQ